MKSKTACVLIAMVCFVIGATCVRGDEPTRQVEVKESGYSLTIPESWKAMPLNGKNAQVMVSLAGPQGCLPSLFHVFATDDTDLADNQLGEALTGNREQIKEMYPDTQMTDAENITVDGVKAVRYTFTKKLKQKDAKTLRLLIIRHKLLYQITFTADAGQYDAVLPAAQKIIDSFKWTN